MSKTVKIPEHMSPYEVMVNGKKYSYPAGTEQEVPNAVAEVIKRDIESRKQVEAEAPEALEQPTWGKKTGTKTVHMDSGGPDGIYMSEDEYNTIIANETLAAYITIFDSGTEETYSTEIPISSLSYDGERMITSEDMTFGWGISYTETLIEYTQIPKEYIETEKTPKIVWASFYQIEEDGNDYTCNKTPEQIEAAIQAGDLVVIREYSFYLQLDSVTVDMVYSSEDSYGGYLLVVGKFSYSVADDVWRKQS